MSVSLGALAPAHWGGVTLAYSSPEHRTNQPLTHAADVFSLGVVLREIVTRSHDETVARTALQSAPRRLRAIVERATKPIPEERYLGAHQLASDVLAYLDEGSLLAAPDRKIDRFRKFTWRHRGWLRALLFAIRSWRLRRLSSNPQKAGLPTNLDWVVMTIRLS